jgi:hypothetical protein
VGQQLGIIDSSGRGDSRQGQPVAIDGNMVLGPRLAAIGRVWPDQITAPLGANTAPVDHDVAQCADFVRPAPDHPDQPGMDLVQYTGGRPGSQAATQGGTGPVRAAKQNPARSGPQFAPLHALTQEEPEGGNDVGGGCWRMTGPLRQRHDLVNQAGNQINRRNGQGP